MEIKTKAIALLNAIAEKELAVERKPRRILCPWCHQELHKTPYWPFTLNGTMGEGQPSGYILAHAGPDEAKACARMKKARLTRSGQAGR